MSATRLTAEADLAAEWGMGPEDMARLRQKHNWEHVRLSRFRVLYTEAQVDAIVRSRTVAGVKAHPKGLTARSARRTA